MAKEQTVMEPLSSDPCWPLSSADHISLHQGSLQALPRGQEAECRQVRGKGHRLSFAHVSYCLPTDDLHSSCSLPVPSFSCYPSLWGSFLWQQGPLSSTSSSEPWVPLCQLSPHFQDLTRPVCSAFPSPWAVGQPAVTTLCIPVTLCLFIPADLHHAFPASLPHS